MQLSGDLEGLSLLACFDDEFIVKHSNSIYTMSIRSRKELPFGVTRPWKPRLPDYQILAVITESSLCLVQANGDLAILHEKKASPEIIPADHGNVTCLSADKDIMCVGRSDTSFTLYQVPDPCRVLHSFPSFRDEIACCASSSAFDLVAVGAHPSTLFLVSVRHRSITRVIDLHGSKPVSLTITNGWGFIVLYTTQVVSDREIPSVELFTVNGHLIRSVKLDFSIERWSTWVSRDGFDYVIVCPKSGKIRKCELFYLQFTSLPANSYGVKALFYSPSLELTLVDQGEGHILMLPFRP
jgi:hypothetical protein